MLEFKLIYDPQKVVKVFEAINKVLVGDNLKLQKNTLSASINKDSLKTEKKAILPQAKDTRKNSAASERGKMSRRQLLCQRFF